MPKSLSKHEFERHKNPPASPLSVFLIISAKAYSSVGFGLSVLAIWLRWFLPEAAAPVPVAYIAVGAPSRSRSRYRSPSRAPRAHILPPTPVRRASAPPNTSPPIPILDYHPGGSNRPRVSFADMQPAAVRRNTAPLDSPRTILEEVLPPTPPLAAQAPLPAPDPIELDIPSLLELPLTTSLTTVMTPAAETTLTLENEKASTPTPTQTPTSTPRSRKLRLSFNLKTKRATPEKPREDAPGQDVVKPPKKQTHVFTHPWTTSRKSPPATEVVVHEISAGTPPTPVNKVFGHKSSSSTSSSSGNSLPSLILSKKSQRRISTPTPRTSPYEAPYFATPPIIFDDSYSKYLRHLPQFDGDMKSPTSPTSGRQASGERPASSDGINPLHPQRPPVHRRSASVNWTPRTIPGVVH